MLRSMTGYGRVFIEDSICSQVWEIRSVNNKYLDIRWKVPSSIRAWESRLEKVVKEYARRGRIDITATLSFADPTVLSTFDTRQASLMIDIVSAFAKERGDTYKVDYGDFFRLQSLWEQADKEIDDSLLESLAQGLKEALEDWDMARVKEADFLKNDLLARVALMDEWVHFFVKRTPVIKNERLYSVRERIQDMMEQFGANFDETRFAQDMVMLIDKIDVSEEITRLLAHLERLRELLETGGDSGRKLDFTLQEAFREITTLGNKVQDVAVSRVVIDFKNELEKCREQVQNLE